jgi:hypothetical protein
MRTMHRWIYAGILWTTSLLAFANDYPRLLYGTALQSRSYANAETFEVTGPLLQIQLNERWVITAARGALINLYNVDNNDFIVRVNAGPVMMLDLFSDQAAELGVGAYRLGTQSLATNQPKADELPYSQGFSLADSVMVKQQAYLDKLKIDVQDINQMMVSIIRGLFPGGAR